MVVNNTNRGSSLKGFLGYLGITKKFIELGLG